MSHGRVRARCAPRHPIKQPFSKAGGLFAYGLRKSVLRVGAQCHLNYGPTIVVFMIRCRRIADPSKRPTSAGTIFRENCWRAARERLHHPRACVEFKHRLMRGLWHGIARAHDPDMHCVNLITLPLPSQMQIPPCDLPARE